MNVITAVRKIPVIFLTIDKSSTAGWRDTERLLPFFRPFAVQ